MSKLLKREKLKEDNSYHISQIAANLPTISDVAYDEGTWNANTDGASKNAIRDKIESLSFYTKDIIQPIFLYGSNGFIETTSQYRALLGVVFSDVNAATISSFYIKDGGSFKVRIIHGGSGANNGKTASGVMHASYDIKDGTQTWDVVSENFDLALNNANIVDWDDSVAMTIADNSSIGVYWGKDDNAGGAAGNMYIYGIVMVRQ